jgi:ATP-dependent helicase/nuclease subunit A
MQRTLSDEQEQAVTRRSGSLLLAAGAGSGKSTVLVERFVRAVLEDGVAPGRILAITFTERAAGELKERVRARFLELGEREAARDTETAFVSTFHGFCARLLRIHPLLAGLHPDFTILEEGLAARLRALAFRRALADFLAGATPRGEAVDLLAAYGADRVRSIVLGVYAELRSRGQHTPALPVPVLPVPALPVPALPPAPTSSSSTTSSTTTSTSTSITTADARATRACELFEELLGGFGRAYAELKHGRGAVDFDDLELLACELLAEREGVRTAWAERFQLMMVDEFQDTNPRQLEILARIERENLFTVGDEHQSIYGFRHADVTLFRARRHELAGRGASLALVRNFRSRAPLLDAVNAVFGARFGHHYTPLEAAVPADEHQAQGCERQAQPREHQAQRCEHQVQPREHQAQPRVELLLTAKRGWEESSSSTQSWRQAEARLLAQRVADLVAAGEVSAGDVVVLLRALGDLPAYERALQECGLRTLATVGGFWSHQQVGDLLAYLRALANPLDELALYSTLASPLVGVSSDGLALLARAARAQKRGVWETLRGIIPAVRPEQHPDLEADVHLNRAPADVDLHARLPSEDRVRLSDFGERFAVEREAAPRRSLSALLTRAIEASGYEHHVLSLNWGERRLANIHKLLRLARQFEAVEGRDLRGFLDHVEHLQESLEGAEPEAPVADTELDAVRLMSIHAAKGLEFGVVCVADLGRAGNVSVPDLLVDDHRHKSTDGQDAVDGHGAADGRGATRGGRIGLRLVGLDGSDALLCLHFEQLREERQQAQAEEEERIMYVAMTRARERLLLSGAVDFERWPEEKPGAPVLAWLGPALVADLPTRTRSLDRPIQELTVSGTVGVGLRLWLNAPSTAQEVLRGQPPDPERIAVLAIATTREPVSPPDTRMQLELPLATSVRADSAAAAPASPRARILSSPAPMDLAGPLSYTALSELERCGYRYYLERILGLPENRRAGARMGGHGGSLEARMRGTIVHRLLASFKRSWQAPSGDDVARVARGLGVRVDANERAEIAALVGAAGATDLAARLTAAPSVHTEHPFAFSLGPGERLFTGVLDVLVKEPHGGWLIVDYKSDRVHEQQDLQILAEREYGVQRVLYALAALHHGAARVEVVHWFLERPRAWVAVHFTAADRSTLEQELLARIERALESAFAVSQTPHRALCLTCPGRGGLCSWDESHTMREAHESVSMGK